MSYNKRGKRMNGIIDILNIVWNNVLVLNELR
jgi:hypothetical protein